MQLVDNRDNEYINFTCSVMRAKITFNVMILQKTLKDLVP